MKRHNASNTAILRFALCFTCLTAWSTAADHTPPSIFSSSQEADGLIRAKKWDEAEAKLLPLLGNPDVPADHPALATVRMKLAQIHCARGNHRDAHAQAAKAANDFEKAMGPENPFAMGARWLAAREALAAGLATDAAELATPMLETLRLYVSSGRAATARWQDVPAFQPFLAELPRFDESGVAAVTSLLGRSWAAAGDAEKAAPVLREAVTILEKVHGRGHPDLVAAQRVLEEVAASRGEKVGRRYVGDLGSFQRIHFEGNAAFASEELRSALACDLGTVLASHPSAEFPDYPEVIRQALRRGYLRAGFGDVNIDVHLDSSRDGGALVARITEGACYRMGAIRIHMEDTALAEGLRQKLLVRQESVKHQSLASTIRNAMKDAAGLLQASAMQDQAAPEGGPGEGNPFAQFQAQGNAATAPTNATSDIADFFGKASLPSDTADWIPGDPAKLDSSAADSLRKTVHRRIAELGHPLANIDITHESNDSGTVDLAIHVHQLGPKASIGKIKVVGCTAHAGAEVAKAAGLEHGLPFGPELIDMATISLWNTGRFYPFAISSRPSGAQGAEVDLTIHVREIAGVPPLGAKIAPETEAACTFIKSLNEQLASGTLPDFVWSRRDETGKENMTFGFSNQDGLLWKSFGKDPGDHQLVSISRDAARLELRHGDRHGSASLPGLTKGVRASLNLLPTMENDGKVTFGFSAGISSAIVDEPLSLEIIVTPALPMLKANRFRKDGGQVVVEGSDGIEYLRIDAETAWPVAGTNQSVEFRNGVVKERQKSIEAAIAANPAADSITGWIEGACALVKLYGDMSPASDRDLKRWTRIVSTLLKPDLLRPFKDWFVSLQDRLRKNETFTIPMDLASMEEVGATMNLFVALGAMEWIEHVAPADSWALKFCREMIFVHGGKTQYAKRTMDELLEDPSIGPFGCLLAARILERIDAGTARRFYSKALDQASSEGFRHDWELLFRSDTSLGQATTQMIEQLARIDPADEKAVLELLSEEHARWLGETIDGLRKIPQGRLTNEWIAPRMNALWTSILDQPFRKQVQSHLAPPQDPTVIAAVVNGQPVRRILVRAIKESLLDFSAIPPTPGVDPAHWTSDPDLAAAIRFTLLEQKLAAQGVKPSQEKAMEILKTSFPHLDGKADEEWIAATGMTRDDLGYIIAKDLLLRSIITFLNNSVKPPTPDQIDNFLRERGPALSRSAHLHTVSVRRPAEISLEAIRRTKALLAQTSDVLQQGLPFTVMVEAAGADSRAGLQLNCETRPLLELNPSLVLDLESMKPGETTRKFMTQSGVYTARLENWVTGDSKPALATNPRIAALLHHEAARTKTLSLCRQFETSADIILLENPVPDPPPTSAFKELVKTNSFGAVGRLGMFWESVISGDESAADALDTLIQEGFLDVAGLIALADALLGQNRQALAKACITEAADRNRDATNKAIDQSTKRAEELRQLLKPEK